MGPKTYLMAFFLLVLFLDVQSCSSSTSRPAGAKFHAENNNGIYWPPEEDINDDDTSSKKARDKSSGSNGANTNHHYPAQRNTYELPEISKDNAENGIIGENNSGVVTAANKHNGENRNEEQPQITVSRDPQQPNVNYYHSKESSSSSGIKTSGDDGSSSSSELIESSIIAPVPEHRTTNNNGGSYTSKSVISSSNSRRLAKSTQGLGLVHFSNKSITCNDGSPAGYYIRKSSYSGNDDNNLWIIFLEGGWYCFDQRSCMNRWHRLNHLMSSSGWPSVKHVGGILSSDLNENPYWWNANHVFIPYCSSDTWSGRVRGNEDGNPFSFMGALIIDEVIKNLIKVEGLNADSSVILAGSSAGGTGVMINLDHVESLLDDEFGPTSTGRDRVKGITDSGWFIDKVPLYTEKANCHDVILCPPEVSLRKGMNLWNARLPDSCQNSHPDEPWICFFGYRIYPTLKASLFVFQWLFDEAQMIVNNVPTPALRKEEWDYVYKVGDELKKTLMNVTNVFIPSCLAHTILTHRDWGRVEVNSVELTRALKCWESGGIIEESNFIPKRKPSQMYWDGNDPESSLHGQRGLFRHGKVYTSSTPSTSSAASSSSDDSFSPTVTSNDSSRRNRRRHNRHRHHNKQTSNNNSSSHNLRQTRRRRKKLEKRQKESSSSRSRHPKSTKSEQRVGEVVIEGDNANPRKLVSSTKRNADRTAQALSTSPSHFHHSNPSGTKNKKNKHKKRKRNRRWYSVCDATPGIYGGATNTEIRLIEKCSWPQCNKSCPKLLNPLTGEEVDFKDLLKSFGLDLATMAKALGIDLATLNSMDHQVLLQMLTQNA